MPTMYVICIVSQKTKLEFIENALLHDLLVLEQILSSENSG